jgi:AcrR family transcriptional regulator
MYFYGYYIHLLLYLRGELIVKKKRTPECSVMNKRHGFVHEKEGRGVKKAKTTDRRIQRTRQLLFNSLIELVLEKDYESITVQNIIDRANVGRSTFYAHFQDKGNLLFSGSDYLSKALENLPAHSSRIDSIWDLSLALFQHAEERRNVFKALLGKKVGNVVMTYIQDSLTAMLRGHFPETHGRKPHSLPLDVFLRYFTSALLGVLAWWLECNATQSAREMNDFFKILSKPTVHALFQQM